MTAALLRSMVGRGLRRVDPRRDMAGLGRLIEGAFAERLDETGRRMVAAMVAFGRWGWLGWMTGQLFLPPAAYPQGYVWLEAGRIVGNASLMRVHEASHRWVLINVAVDPGWRRRGIASSLVEACLDEARQRGAREVVLQVDASNSGACALYSRFGFDLVSTRGTWSRTSAWSRPPIPAGPARRRRADDTPQQLGMVQRLHPEGLLWPRPLDGDVLRLTLALGSAGHWVWPSTGPVRGFLSGFPGYEAAGVHLVMVLDSEARGLAEEPLLGQALIELPHRTDSLRLEAAEGADEGVFRRCGFQLDRRLAWMALKLGEAEGVPCLTQ